MIIPRKNASWRRSERRNGETERAISRRRHGSRCRRSAKRSKPPPRSRPPARIAASARRISRFRWAAYRRGRSLPHVADPQRHHHRGGKPRRRPARGLDAARRGLRRRNAGDRDRPRTTTFSLYRELIRRGVSDYLIAPIGTLDVVRAICGLFSDRQTPSRSAASLRWSAPRAASAPRPSPTMSPGRSRAICALDAVVTDLDLAFGTAGLDYNQDPPQGIADAVFSPDRIDTSFLDRLLSKCTDHLSLLAAPATLDRVYDFVDRGVRFDLRHAAHIDALHRARRAASMDGLDASARWSPPTTS